MPSKGYINKFPEGLDKDSDDKIRKNTTYKDAHHVQISGDGKYGGLQNLKGTTLIDTVLSTVTYSTINVLGAYKARTLVNTSSVEDCVYIFYIKDISSVYTFVIDIFRPSDGNTYTAYSKVVTSSGMLSVLDAFIIGDAGVDTLYYTTAEMPLGRLRCDLSTSTPTLVERQTELLKRYPSNKLEVSDILYNPKSEAAASDTHTIAFSLIGETNTSTFKDWDADALLDADTTAGDQ